MAIKYTPHPFYILLGFLVFLPIGLLDFQNPISNALSVSICQTQGSGFSSPFVGQEIITQGVVILDVDENWQKGFYIQHENCDGDPATSDGIFVYLGEKIQLVSRGQLVQVRGNVSEYYGLTEILASPADVVILASSVLLPSPGELNPPADALASAQYFEARENMRVAVSSGRVVGPTDRDDRSWLARSNLGIAHIFYDQPGGTGQLLCVDDGGDYEITPEVKSGDLVSGLVGALDYRYSKYCLQLDSAPLVNPSLSNEAALAQSLDVAFTFRAATFNLANLFDRVDDPSTEDPLPGETEYLRGLHKRAQALEALGLVELLVVQEVENMGVLTALLAEPEIPAGYSALLIDGPDRRGIDVALLYNSSRVQPLEYTARQGCTSLIDGLGPDGNGDVYSPANAITCDSDGNLVPDGNRLFSRPPMVARLRICRVACSSLAALPEDMEIWVIANHWKSKLQDTNYTAYTLPRRTAQAQFVAGLVADLRGAHPGMPVLVLGDFNDYPNSVPLTILGSSGVRDLTLDAIPAERYTYIYQGLAQIPDQAWIGLTPGLAPLSVAPLHLNADYPYSMTTDESVHRSSDHDPLWLQFGILDNTVYLPLVVR